MQEALIAFAVMLGLTFLRLSIAFSMALVGFLGFAYIVNTTAALSMVGSVAFGIIDRGTSLLQVRPSCSCILDCPFCSVDAGPCSRTRATEYRVDRDYLVDCVREAVAFKGPGVECHIDSPGTNFEEDGGLSLIGKNLLDCHPEPALSQLKEMMRTHTKNVYTIEKNGKKKLLYQSPWYADGKYAGFVEMSLEIPFEMPHFVRE